MIEGPGTGCALVMCDQEDIRCTPREYCKTTVLPVIAQIMQKRRVNRIRHRMKKGREHGSLTDIGEFSIFEDEEIMFLAVCDKLVDQVLIEVLNDIDVGL